VIDIDVEAKAGDGIECPLRILQTLGNREWVRQNEQAIKDLFPDTWTHVMNLNPVAIGFGLKLIGIDYRTDAEYCKVVQFFEDVGILMRDGYLVRRSHLPVFDEKGNPIGHKRKRSQ